MSYSLQGWDQLIPESEGALPQTYRYTVSSVRNLPSGTEPSLVPQRVALYMGNMGIFDYWNARWAAGGTLVLQYRARRGTTAYGSGVERRRAVEAALAQASRSLGPRVVFGRAVPPGAATRVPRWVLGGVAVVLLAGTLAFFAGTAVEGERRERVRVNQRRRR